MQGSVKALIFDMDGVLIDSEPLWRRAMMKGFAKAGMPLTEEDCRKTMGLRFVEVIRYWINFYKKNDVSVELLEKEVMTLLLELIEKEGKLMEGITEIVDFCRKKNIQMGLATSSSNLLMNAVLKKLDLHEHLQVCVSAEHLHYGKPHPEVFLNCARLLNTDPKECVVIEDSMNGVIAGKAAQMMVIAVPEDKFQKIDKFIVADFTCMKMREVLGVLEGLA